MTDTVYDMVILGAGSGGYAAALRGTQLGLRVALIEADKIGGTCLHRGCVPTKAILHSAETAEAEEPTEAASSLMIMAMGAEKGDQVVVTSDNAEAVEKIAGLIERDLDAE